MLASGVGSWIFALVAICVLIGHSLVRHFRAERQRKKVREEAQGRLIISFVEPTPWRAVIGLGGLIVCAELLGLTIDRDLVLLSRQNQDGASVVALGEGLLAMEGVALALFVGAVGLSVQSRASVFGADLSIRLVPRWRAFAIALTAVISLLAVGALLAQGSELRGWHEGLWADLAVVFSGSSILLLLGSTWWLLARHTGHDQVAREIGRLARSSKFYTATKSYGYGYPHNKMPEPFRLLELGISGARRHGDAALAAAIVKSWCDGVEDQKIFGYLRAKLPLNLGNAAYWALKDFKLSRSDSDFLKGLDLGQAAIVERLTRHGDHRLGYLLADLSSVIYPPFGEGERNHDRRTPPWLADSRQPGFRTLDSVTTHLLESNQLTTAEHHIRREWFRVLSIGAMWAERIGDQEGDGLRPQMLFDTFDGPLEALQSYANPSGIGRPNEIVESVAEALVRVMEHCNSQINADGLLHALHLIEPYEIDALRGSRRSLKEMVASGRVSNEAATTVVCRELEARANCEVSWSVREAVELWGAVAQFNFDRRIEARLADALAVLAAGQFEAGPYYGFGFTRGETPRGLTNFELVEAMDKLSLAGRARVRRRLRGWVSERSADRDWLRTYLGRHMVRDRRKRLLRPGYARVPNS